MIIKGILRNYFVFGIGQIINLISPLIVAPIVIFYCGLNAWGQVGVVTSILNIICLFIDFGSLLIGVREISSNIGNKIFLTKYISTVYFFRIFAFCLVFIFYLSIIYIFNVKEKELYLLSSLFLISQFLNPLWIYQGFEKFSVINRIIFLSKILYIILVFIFIKQKESYVYTIFFLSIGNILVYGYYLYKIVKEYNIGFFNTSIKEVICNFKNEYPIFINNLSISIYTNSPMIMVSNLLGETAAGIFKLIEMFLSIFRSYLSVFFNVSFPRFCKIFSIDRIKSYLFLKKLNIAHLIILFVSLIIVYILTTYLLNTSIFESELKQSIKSSILLLFLPLIIAFNIPFYQILLVFNEQKKLATLSVLGAFLCISLIYFSTNYLKIYGVIFSIYIVELTITLSMIYMVIKGNYLKNGN